GYVGLFLFIGIIYWSLRTLIAARTSNTDEERIRRILFVLVFSYIISSWMVNFTYRVSFFLMAAAIAAFHRQLMEKNQPKDLEDEEVQSAPELVPSLAMSRLQLAPIASGHIAESVH